MKINFNKVEEKLNEVQRRAITRTITINDIEEYLERITDKYHICGMSFKGVKVCINVHAQKFSSAYRGIPETTYFTAEFNGREWRITNITRARCDNKTVEFINFPGDAMKKAIENIAKTIC